AAVGAVAGRLGELGPRHAGDDARHIVHHLPGALDPGRHGKAVLDPDRHCCLRGSRSWSRLRSPGYRGRGVYGRSLEPPTGSAWRRPFGSPSALTSLSETPSLIFPCCGPPGRDRCPRIDLAPSTSDRVLSNLKKEAAMMRNRFHFIS